MVVVSFFCTRKTEGIKTPSATRNLASLTLPIANYRIHPIVTNDSQAFFSSFCKVQDLDSQNMRTALKIGF